VYDLLEEVAAEYKEMPDDLVDEDFLEEVLETVRRLRERYYTRHDERDSGD
jgi:hypothetical protein